MKKRTWIVVASVLVMVHSTAGIAGAITNGEPDAGRHPYIGLLVFDVGGGPAWRCSGDRHVLALASILIAR